VEYRKHFFGDPHMEHQRVFHVCYEISLAFLDDGIMLSVLFIIWSSQKFIEGANSYPDRKEN
jgi:hypothetical protein